MMGSAWRGGGIGTIDVRDVRAATITAIILPTSIVQYRGISIAGMGDGCKDDMHNFLRIGPYTICMNIHCLV